MSKRDGAVSVGEYRDNGYLPEALVNFLALLGWNPGDAREKMSLKELIESFDLDRIIPKPAAFNETKLEWMNGQYLIDSSVEYLVPEVTRLLELRGYGSKVKEHPETVVTHVRLLKDRSKRLDELVDTGLYFWDDPTEYESKAWDKYVKPETNAHLVHAVAALADADWNAVALEALYRALTETLEVKFAALIHPTRLAISGMSFGPGLFELMEALGRDVVLRRMNTLLQHVAQTTALNNA
jgi:glutamyl-tRNA synthetase